MKLSNDTVTVLKNFSTIKQNLVIKAGNTISTMSAMKNIVAKAVVKESFPSDFAIYDLNEFLAALSLFSKPELDFSDIQKNYEGRSDRTFLEAQLGEKYYIDEKTGMIFQMTLLLSKKKVIKEVSL